MGLGDARPLRRCRRSAGFRSRFRPSWVRPSSRRADRIDSPRGQHADNWPRRGRVRFHADIARSVDRPNRLSVALKIGAPRPADSGSEPCPTACWSRPCWIPATRTDRAADEPGERSFATFPAVDPDEPLLGRRVPPAPDDFLRFAGPRCTHRPGGTQLRRPTKSANHRRGPASRAIANFQLFLKWAARIFTS
jgi:hypothetical protein